MLRRAPEFSLNLRAASPVQKRNAGSVTVGEIMVAPLHKRDERRQQVRPFLGQPVPLPNPLPRVLVRFTEQQLVGYKEGQAVAEHRPGNLEVRLKVTETGRAVKRFAENQKRPLLTEKLQRAGNRTLIPADVGVSVKRCSVHHLSIAELLL